MLNISNCTCTSYLAANYFTDIQFLSEDQGNLYFSAIDEDDTLTYIEFEAAGEAIFVNVKYSKDEPYVVLERLQD